MNENTDHGDFLNKTKEQVEEYLKLRLELLKLELGEKTAKVSASLFSMLILIFLSFFTLFFLSFMAGFYFSRLLNDNFMGFGIIALLYLLSLVIISIFRKQIIEKPTINKIIKNIFNNDQG